ncbi:excisionase [Amycolatopsis carbonis]|uniref:Excisionase n=1 Tax=Amycolatopsis carbonis TaxID=715471 RepID=A0A9Y2N1Q1_9PSEU|nr:excisionase [Amycolatopsis sp. 2-15]WIX83217.1 excisionase [Amycolatopsis sp. 2-15]
MNRPSRLLTVMEVRDELPVARSTFYEWRMKRRGPRCIKLPNGEFRIRRADPDRWIDEREEDVKW